MLMERMLDAHGPRKGKTVGAHTSALGLGGLAGGDVKG
jgi:hypothetical protein